MARITKHEQTLIINQRNAELIALREQLSVANTELRNLREQNAVLRSLDTESSDADDAMLTENIELRKQVEELRARAEKAEATASKFQAEFAEQARWAGIFRRKLAALQETTSTKREYTPPPKTLEQIARRAAMDAAKAKAMAEKTNVNV